MHGLSRKLLAASIKMEKLSSETAAATFRFVVYWVDNRQRAGEIVASVFASQAKTGPHFPILDAFQYIYKGAKFDDEELTEVSRESFGS